MEEKKQNCCIYRGWIVPLICGIVSMGVSITAIILGAIYCNKSSMDAQIICICIIAIAISVCCIICSTIIAVHNIHYCKAQQVATANNENLDRLIDLHCQYLQKKLEE